MLALSVARPDADVLYEQSPNPAGGSYVSSWWDPDGSNYDQYVWDAFTLDRSANIHSIAWRGTFGATGPATNFTVALYASIPAGTQPDLSRPPLVEYQTGDDAGQTYAGVFGGAAMYDHSFTLPVPFPAQTGEKYWLQIEAWQPGFPDWRIAAGLGGDGSHFLCEHNNIVAGGGVPPGCWFTARTGDAAFTLLTTDPIGVDDSRSNDFGLTGVVPNPSRGERFAVRFRLPDTAPSQLAIFDAGGRLMASEEVGALGAGVHVVDLSLQPPIRPGIYFIRLSRAGRNANTRAAVVR
jgi:hypothetical protein